MTDNKIGGTGATSLSESLRSNTTLNQSDEYKKKKTHKRHTSTIHVFTFSPNSTGNDIGDTGASSLSEALKSNTTLTELNLSCEDKRQKTHKNHSQTNYSFPFS